MDFSECADVGVGHTITAATVTILYHGRFNEDRPITLDWLAIDPEHSIVFCGSKCYLYTYVTTRTLRLVYFDGSSAAKIMYSGVSQDIVIWGKVRPDMNHNEGVLIQELCRWGRQFKLDGFVRYLGVGLIGEALHGRRHCGTYFKTLSRNETSLSKSRKPDLRP